MAKRKRSTSKHRRSGRGRGGGAARSDPAAIDWGAYFVPLSIVLGGLIAFAVILIASSFRAHGHVHVRVNTLVVAIYAMVGVLWCIALRVRLRRPARPAGGAQGRWWRRRPDGPG